MREENDENRIFNVPNDLPFLTIAGDKSDKNKKHRLTLNFQRLKDIFDYLMATNRYYKEYVKWNEV